MLFAYNEENEEEFNEDLDEGTLLGDDEDEENDDDDSFENDGEVYLIDHEEALPAIVVPVTSVVEDSTPVIDTADTPKPKKKRVPSEAKLTKDFRKRWFSSLTARRSPVTFFGIADTKKTLVMTNTEGGLFTEYRNPRLGVHVVRFKQDEDWNRIIKLREDLQLTDPRRVYITNVTRYLAACNKHKVENVVLWKPDDRTVCCNNEVLTPYKKENVVAVTLANFYVADLIRSLYKRIAAFDTEEEDTRIHQWVTLDKHPEMTSILSFVRLDTHLFTDANGVSLFADRRRYLQIPLFDGIGTPSTKEFVYKQDSESLYRMYAWVEDNSYIRTMTVYEDDHVKVFSMNPNLIYRPGRVSQSLNV